MTIRHILDVLVIYTFNLQLQLFTLPYLHLLIYILIYALFILLYEFDKTDKIWKIYIYRNYDKTFQIDDDYLEAAAGGGIKNFVIFTGKHLCWSLFLIKLQACKFIEKRLQHWCFLLHVKKFSRTPILKNIREQLLLIIMLVLSNLFVFRCLFTMIKKNCSFR